MLVERGVVVAGMISANAGGVVVSYFEGRYNQAYCGRRTRRSGSGSSTGCRVVARSRRSRSAEGAGRCATRHHRVRRVAEAHKIRGLYPDVPDRRRLHVLTTSALRVRRGVRRVTVGRARGMTTARRGVGPT